MTEREEGSELAMNYLDNLIRVADKYEIDREKYVKICIMALVMTVETINFKTYHSEN